MREGFCRGNGSTYNVETVFPVFGGVNTDEW